MFCWDFLHSFRIGVDRMVSYRIVSVVSYRMVSYLFCPSILASIDCERFFFIFLLVCQASIIQARCEEQGRSSRLAASPLVDRAHSNN